MMLKSQVLKCMFIFRILLMLYYKYQVPKRIKRFNITAPLKLYCYRFSHIRSIYLQLLSLLVHHPIHNLNFFMNCNSLSKISDTETSESNRAIPKPLFLLMDKAYQTPFWGSNLVYKKIMGLLLFFHLNQYPSLQLPIAL